MRTRTLLSLLAVAALAVVLATPAAASVAVGDKAPAFTLTDLAGQQHSLSDFAGKVVVLEWINPNCPFSDRHAKEKTMIDLSHAHGEVVWLGINSTNPDHRDFLTPAKHQAWATERGVDYAILYDESGEVGHAYGAHTTPHMFVIDESGTVVYDGAIDDDPPGRQAKAERTNYVDDGLTAHEASQAIAPASTKPYGCSVKY